MIGYMDLIYYVILHKTMGILENGGVSRDDF